jgi:hypothetical protein
VIYAGIESVYKSSRRAGDEAKPEDIAIEVARTIDRARLPLVQPPSVHPGDALTVSVRERGVLVGFAMLLSWANPAFLKKRNNTKVRNVQVIDALELVIGYGPAQRGEQTEQAEQTEQTELQFDSGGAGAVRLALGLEPGRRVAVRGDVVRAICQRASDHAKQCVVRADKGPAPLLLSAPRVRVPAPAPPAAPAPRGRPSATSATACASVHAVLGAWDSVGRLLFGD